MTIRLFFFLLGLTITSSNLQAAPGDEKHLLGSAAITHVSYQALQGKSNYPRIHAAGIALLAGIGKELTDEQFSGEDVKFDMLGISLGLLTSWQFSW